MFLVYLINMQDWIIVLCLLWQMLSFRAVRNKKEWRTVSGLICFTILLANADDVFRYLVATTSYLYVTFINNFVIVNDQSDFNLVTIAKCAHNRISTIFIHFNIYVQDIFLLSFGWKLVILLLFNLFFLYFVVFFLPQIL